MMVELWNGRAWGLQGMGVNSLLELLRKVMLRRWRINPMKGLGKFLNRTSYAWKKLNGAGHIRWDVVSRVYTWEYGSQWKHLKTMGGVKKDEDVMATRDCIQRSTN